VKTTTIHLIGAIIGLILGVGAFAYMNQPDPPCITCLTFDAQALYNESIDADYIFISEFPEGIRLFEIQNKTVRPVNEKNKENTSEILKEKSKIKSFEFTVHYLKK